MALTFPKRGFSGYAVAGTLSAPGLTSSDSTGVTFTSSTTLTGWVDVTGGTFSGANICVTFGYGTSTEEKILCTFNTSTSTFTIVTRGYEGGTAQTWATGSLFVMTSTATEAAELNAVTQSMKTILTNVGTTTTPQPITVGSGTGSIGTGTKPAAIDHDHKISVSTLNGWLTGSAAGQINSAATIYPTSISAGALASGVTIPLSQVTNPPAADYADSSTNYSVTFTTTANALASSVNPAGNFKQYVWRVNFTQQSNASAATVDVSAILRYRVVGSSTWTNLASVNAGTCVSTNDFRSIGTGGVLTLGSADDYEFQIGFQSGASGQTVSLNRIRLVVEGLN